jgi:hypothetical protein
MRDPLKSLGGNGSWLSSVLGAAILVAVVVPVRVAYQLSLAKRFIDQALPSAGIGSTIIVATALERRG